jgi:cystathionine beta-lyase
VGPSALREAWDVQPDHLFGVVSRVGVEATRAAWQDGNGWLATALGVLDRNRRLLRGLLAERLPAVDYALPQATYLAWLDFRALGLADRPETLLRDGGVVLYPGPDFGPDGEGFARCNFATSASVLEAGVDRMAGALLTV